MMKNKNSILIYLLMEVLLILTSSCKKDDNKSTNNSINGNSAAVFNTSLTYGLMTDQNGNIYKTILIGTQTWMAENLRTAKYRNGEAISEVTDSVAWSKILNTGAYCNFKNTRDTDSIVTYGRLYNWYAATDARNIAPTGWHLPTDDEWTTLTTYLGGESVAGDKLKESGTIHWDSSSGADNSSGFTALPDGYRDNNGAFGTIGGFGYWWSSSESSATFARLRFIASISSSAHRGTGAKVVGFSIRCIKDN
jgi:uncharacterized protein (TIGR02145 family)